MHFIQMQNTFFDTGGIEDEDKAVVVSQRVTRPGSRRDQQLPSGSLAVTPPGHPSPCPRNLPLHRLPLIVSLSCQEQ